MVNPSFKNEIIMILSKANQIIILYEQFDTDIRNKYL